jgi:hypothetical protein
MKKALLTAGFLVTVCGQALAQVPVVDGQLDSNGAYPFRLWSNWVGTQFGNNQPAGAGGNPALVTTGVEYRIPLATLASPSFPMRICPMVTSGGHYNLSNQIAGGVPLNTDTLGPTGQANLGNVAGTQYADTGTPAVQGTGPTIDGVLDAGLYTQVFLQGAGAYTTGDNLAVGANNTSNGSEIDAIYVSRTATDLYIFVAGNLKTDFGDAMDLFVDSAAGAGQNVLLNTNADINYNNLNNNMAGLTFDSGFDADYVILLNGGNDPAEFYADSAQLVAGGGGAGGFQGGSGQSVGSLAVITGTPDGIEIGINNSNIAGLGGKPTTSPDFANGSEINNFYAKIVNGRLYGFIGGNLESNYNNLELFFDVDNTSSNGGQAELRSDNVDIDFNGLNRMGIGGNADPNANPNNGLRFDGASDAYPSAFVPDYWVRFGTNGTDMYMNAAVLRTDGPERFVGGVLDGSMKDYGAYSGGNKALNNPSPWPATNIDIQDGSKPYLYTNMGPRTAAATNGSPAVAGLLSGSIDNRNDAGVGGYNGSVDLGSDAPYVDKGIEFSIDLTELGWDGQSIVRVAGFITGGGHGYMSNQVLGAFLDANGDPAALGNLAEVTYVDFSAIDGPQYLSTCISDINRDGVSDLGDYFEFFNRFDQTLFGGDINGDFSVDLGDFFDFLNGFDTGC